MKTKRNVVLLWLVLFLNLGSFATDIKLVNVKFQEPWAPKTEVKREINWVTNHFSVSGSYRIEIELQCDIPANYCFNVTTYALIGANKIMLGDARVGRGNMTGHVLVAYDIFPSILNYYGACEFLVVVDSQNEINESDESALSNQWKFNATVHAPGERY